MVDSVSTILFPMADEFREHGVAKEITRPLGLPARFPDRPFSQVIALSTTNDRLHYGILIPIARRSCSGSETPVVIIHFVDPSDGDQEPNRWWVEDDGKVV